jgi:uracil-DNA glycosylase
MKQPYFTEIKQKIVLDLNAWITIYPPLNQVFNAFEKTPFADLRIVILGQDPYHGPNQAQWFCFSVPKWVTLPPSLQNIYKEIEDSLWIKNWESGDLTPWTKQWVFLLNSALTVQAGKPMSHAQIGWEKFTDYVIKSISDKKTWVIFLLWGAFAQSKKYLIDENKHIVLETTHPSPFSAHRGFLGSECFKKVNEILEARGEKVIDWRVD